MFFKSENIFYSYLNKNKNSISSFGVSFNFGPNFSQSLVVDSSFNYGSFEFWL
jgi:hypothetical protein